MADGLRGQDWYSVARFGRFIDLRRWGKTVITERSGGGLQVRATGKWSHLTVGHRHAYMDVVMRHSDVRATQEAKAG